jgi:hypothetical protein
MSYQLAVATGCFKTATSSGSSRSASSSSLIRPSSTSAFTSATTPANVDPLIEGLPMA